MNTTQLRASQPDQRRTPPPPRRRLRFAVAAAAFLFLTSACGGGGTGLAVPMGTKCVGMARFAFDAIFVCPLGTGTNGFCTYTLQTDSRVASVQPSIVVVEENTSRVISMRSVGRSAGWTDVLVTDQRGNQSVMGTIRTDCNP